MGQSEGGEEKKKFPLRLTYSGPMSLLPELLKAPRRIASLFSGWSASMVGVDEVEEMTIGEKKIAAPATVVMTAVPILFFAERNDMIASR